MDKDFSFLKERYIIDLVKPDVDQFERAALIASLMKDKGWSQREVARQYGIPHSTVQDWLLFNLISEKDYKALLDSGMHPVDIYRALREKRSVNAVSSGKSSKKVAGLCEVDVFIMETKRRLRVFRGNKSHSVKTMLLIDDLVNELNSYGADINR